MEKKRKEGKGQDKRGKKIKEGRKTEERKDDREQKQTI